MRVHLMIIVNIAAATIMSFGGLNANGEKMPFAASQFMFRFFFAGGGYGVSDSVHGRRDPSPAVRL